MTSTSTVGKKTYYELGLPLAGFNTDHLSGILHSAGCSGIYELSETEWIVYLPANWQGEQYNALIAELGRVNPALSLENITFDEKPYEDWHLSWRKYFTPFQATKTIWLRPPWQPLPPEARGTEIIIDPQMAFGTGHHETTKLMIQAMEKTGVAGKNLLDLGTGSGILAILARKLGAKHVIGVDIDPDAIDNAHHNTKLNDVDGIDWIVGDIESVSGETFPLILANIQFHVLSQLPLQFYHFLEMGSHLILSGLLKTDVNRIYYLYKHAGLLPVEKLDLKEWSALIMEKPAK